MTKKEMESDKTAILACDVLNQAMPAPYAPLLDSEIIAHCGNCNAQAPLGKYSVLPDGKTLYHCAQCTALLVEISQAPPPGVAAPNGGYRFANSILRNLATLRARGVVLDKIPDGLAQKS